MSLFVIFAEAEGQILSDTIQRSGKPFNLDDADYDTVKFYMRHATSDVLKVDAGPVTVEDAEAGEVAYPWVDDDIDEPGEYYGWWRVNLQNGTEIDTDEFFIIVSKHSPGLRTTTGPVYRRARSKMPTSWIALEKQESYGDALLQEQIDVTKLRLFGVTQTVADESTYDLRVVDYLAKLACVAIIPAAIDYWIDQHQTISTSGGPGVEISTYPDRIEALKLLQETLLGEIVADKPIIDDIIDYPVLTPAHAVPGVSDGGDECEGFVTPNPTYHFYDYAFPGRRARRYRSNNQPWPFPDGTSG